MKAEGGSMFKKFRWLWILLALALAAGAYFYWRGRGAPAPVWRTAPIERGSIQVAVTATGTLQALVTVQVGTQVSGTVSALYADFNSQVKKGQVIARIDTTLLRATLADAMSNLEKAAAQQHQAAEELKRTRALFARTLVSQADLDQAEANSQVASATLNSAKAQVDRARINLRYATIISPIDGIVLSRAVDVGQTVAASFNTPTLFTIAGDLREMQVQAGVDEADIGKIRTGQTASFTVDAYPDITFSGTVEQIRLQPNTVQNVVSYDVVIRVPNPDLKLMPGMTANLSIAVARKDDVLIVPTAALRFQPPGQAKDKGNGKGTWGRDSAGGSGGQGAGRRGDSTGGGGGQWAGRRNGDSSGGRWAGHRGDGTGGEGPRRGRIFVLEGGELKPVRVELGLSDGSHTEISGQVAEGQSVVVGVQAPETKGPSGGTSPFGMPRGGGGGGGGRRM
jgi:HlyD family secretion protein